MSPKSPKSLNTVWTIGHSTHALEEFVSLLKGAGIEQVVDVRSVPRSRHVPQFNKDELAAGLPPEGIDYVHMEDLGGWRRPADDSPNTGWRNAGFRGYADYMQTDQFRRAASGLMSLAKKKRTAIMCAEGLPFRCHRSIIADYLTAHGLEVVHIYPDGKVKPHTLTPFARVRDGSVTYPPGGGPGR